MKPNFSPRTFLMGLILTECVLCAHSQGVIGTMPAFYQDLKATLTYPLSWENSGIVPGKKGLVSEKRFLQWRQQGRDKVLECLSPAPPCNGLWNMTITDSEPREGYTAHKIEFNVNDWCRIPAYLLIPDGEGPHPGLLLMHDHGAHFSIGKEKMIRPFEVSDEVMEDAKKWTVACYDSVFVGDYFARNGYAVLSIDALFWGERGRVQGPDYDAQQALNANLEQMGMSLGNFIVWDDLRCADFMASLPQVKEGGIAVAGHSMGCYRAWTTAALSDKVKACVAVCWMNTTDSLMTLTNNQNKGGSAYAMLIQGLRNWLDYPDVASLACPKPMFFMNGRYDKLFPVAGVEAAYDKMRKVWKDCGQEAHFQTEIVDGPHYYDKKMQANSLLFFDRYMK